MLWLKLLPIAFLIIYHLEHVASITDDDRDFQAKLLKNYNSKIRPVKLETTVTQVTVFLNIAHVEKVDEAEQTALVHGHLWASWTDEYLQWDRSNNITKITLPSNRIWQPALALYNSARGNTWHLYMAGMPATIYYTGKVWSSGTFSFFVTCQFDFVNWPFDQQSCPIVIADWVYGLAQVNLSDPNTVAEYAKPSIRLSYDPLDRKNKRHVGGWEVMDAWKKHCYWGPKGCKEEQPEGEPDWYWSLLEFGIILKRHLPYFQMTILLPIIVTSLLVLLGFWIDQCSLNAFVVFFNLVLQTLYGYNMMKKLPPGSGSIPKVVQIFTLNLLLTGFQFLMVIAFGFIKEFSPKKYVFDFGFDITEIPKKMGIATFFTPKGLSFDPQQMFVEQSEIDELEAAMKNGDTSPSIGIGNPLNDDGFESFQQSATSSTTSDTAVLINLPTNSDEPAALTDSIENLGVDDAKLEAKLDQVPERQLVIQLLHIKRYLFFLVIFIYCLVFLMVLFL